jgi:autotransporter-associated beta strand protein
MIPGVAAGATCTWTGGGTNNNWSTAANWNNCGGAHATPQNGDAIVFPSGASRPTPNDDIATLSLASVSINGVAIGNTRYALTASAAVPIVLQTGGFVQFNAPGDALSSGPVFQVPLKLSANGVISNINTPPVRVDSTIDLNGFQLIVATSNANLNFTNIITGSGTLVKNGPGTLFLEGDNTFSAPFTINAGRVNARHNNALGSTAGSTEVKVGASLVLDGPLIVPETIRLSAGVLEVDSFAATVSGLLDVLASSSVLTQSTGILTITGPIQSGGTLTKLGAGAAIFAGDSPACTGVVAVQTGSCRSMVTCRAAR